MSSATNAEKRNFEEDNRQDDQGILDPSSKKRKLTTHAENFDCQARADNNSPTSPSHPMFSPTWSLSESPKYAPVSPTYGGTSPDETSSTVARYGCDTPNYDQSSPEYAANPAHNRQSPRALPSPYVPTSPVYATSSPMYFPTGPICTKSPPGHGAPISPSNSTYRPSSPFHDFGSRIQPPGMIETQPTSKVVFNAPFLYTQTCNVKIINTSNHRIGFKIKTSNLRRFGLDQSYGVLDPNRTLILTLSCLPFTFRQEDYHDELIVQWTNFPEGTDELFSHDWFQRSEMVKQKSLPIEYNL